ncbi:MAG: hypothetical protein R3B13_21500 [Polyangiaceae bacterium]
MTPLERVTERVTRNGHPDEEGTPRPLLTLSEFFDGNDVDGSIGCNLNPMPTPSQMRAVLERILGRPDVADVLIQVSMFDDPQWPFSDTIWVITNASPDDLQGWFPEQFKPDEVWEGWQDGTLYEPYVVPQGTRPLGVFFD